MNHYLTKTEGWIWPARFIQNYLGYPHPPSSLTMRVGDRMQLYYAAETGEQPQTALCPKTNGSKSTQQHAIYPPVEKWLKAMRKFTDEVIEELRQIGIELARQLELFSDDKVEPKPEEPAVTDQERIRRKGLSIRMMIDGKRELDIPHDKLDVA
jgi:hypothetical protein